MYIREVFKIIIEDKRGFGCDIFYTYYKA